MYSLLLVDSTQQMDSLEV